MMHTVTIEGSTVQWEYRKKVGEAWVPEATDEHLSSYEKGIIKKALDIGHHEGYIQYTSGGRTKWRKMIWTTQDTSTEAKV